MDLVVIVVVTIAVGVVHQRRVGRAQEWQRPARMPEPHLVAELVQKCCIERSLAASAHVAELRGLASSALVDLDVVREPAVLQWQEFVSEIPPRAARVLRRERAEPDRYQM